MIHPPRPFYRPGEHVELPLPGAFRAEIWHLHERVAQIEGRHRLRWLPPADPKRGYRVRVCTNGETHWTAFDVLDGWTDAPRYGYLFDFSPHHPDYNLDWLLAHHVNALQFYDWHYRHDCLLPPHDTYRDPLGRELSLRTIRGLIDAAHAGGMAAMPYTAIYAASPEFAAQHPEWGLYDEGGRLYDFADNFLKIMNPASEWRDHLVRDCRAVLDTLPFDGLHVDQYGEPRGGYDVTGAPVNLPGAIAETLRALRRSLSQNQQLVFNLVHNWPLDAVRGAPVDFLYSELWPPQTTLGDLARIARTNREALGGRPPVLAIYMDPAHENTILLAQSVIAASGAYHIAHGENGLYLSDPYFPKSQRPSVALAKRLRQIADFSVAYGELLTFAEPADMESEVTVADDLWPITRRRDDCLVLNLINARPEQRWDTRLPPSPIRQGAAVDIRLERPVTGVWCAAPDVEAPPQPLDFTSGDGALQFHVPAVDRWTLIWIRVDSRHAGSRTSQP